MASIYDENILKIITQYTAEEYITDVKRTEIVTIIPLCNMCLKFTNFKKRCEECINKRKEVRDLQSQLRLLTGRLNFYENAYQDQVGILKRNKFMLEEEISELLNKN